MAPRPPGRRRREDVLGVTAGWSGADDENDLLGHYDDIVTDQRLSLELVEAHLEQLRSDGYLLDE